VIDPGGSFSSDFVNRFTRWAVASVVALYQIAPDPGRAGTGRNDHPGDVSDCGGHRREDDYGHTNALPNSLGGRGSAGYGSCRACGGHGCRAGREQAEPVDLPNGPAKPGFDITRFSNAGNGWFETFHVSQTELLREALKAGKVAEDTRLLVTEIATGRLALITEQMAFHHLAQGRAGGKDWLVTF